MRLKGKVAIVTGASSGIGTDSALEFGRQGAKVCCTGNRSMKGAEAVAEKINKEMGSKKPGQGGEKIFQLLCS